MLGAIDQGYLYNMLDALLGARRRGAAAYRRRNGRAAAWISTSALQELATLLHRIALAQTVPQAIARG